MKRAFTLVEVLVSVCVIILLLSIAVPSYQIVSARGAAARCLGNLRALGTALNLFLGENQMIMPSLAAARRSKDEEVPAIDTTLDRYLDDNAAFTCPAGKHLAETTGTSYFWNSALNGQPASQLNLFGIVTELGRIPILVDKEGWHKYTDDKVNHLFGDGHVTSELRLFAE